MCMMVNLVDHHLLLSKRRNDTELNWKMIVEPRTNVQKKLTCIKIEHVRDILNQARNPNRVSLAKGKKEKKKHTNKQQQQAKTKTSSSAATTAATTKTKI